MKPQMQRCMLHILLNVPVGESAGLIKGGDKFIATRSRTMITNK
jgi:hypothetical protein